MHGILQDCIRTQKVASLYFDKDNPFSHLTGRILQIRQNEVLIAHISMHGCSDGYILKRIDDLYRVDVDGKYEQKIGRLYSIKGQSHPPISIDASDRSLLQTLLNFAKQARLIVTFEFADECLSGFVESVRHETVDLRIVDEYGVICGLAQLLASEVSTVSVDTDDEQDIRLLVDAIIN